MLDRLVEDAGNALEELADCELTIAGVVVPAIWVAPAERVFGALDASLPGATITASAAAGVQRGTTFTRSTDGLTWRVIGIEPDGHGLVTLRVELSE